jgi:tape measure domain-containing protein
MAQKETFEIGLKDNLSPGLQNASKYLDGLREKFSSLDGVVGKIGLALGGLFVADKIWEMTKGVASLGIEMEQTRVRFETMLGSEKEALKMIDQVYAMANKTPFTSKDLFKASETLMQFGVAGDEILPMLSVLGDVSGGNAERFDRMALAMAQSSAAGRLMGQDLLQMVNAGFNPLQVISEKTGKSMLFLKKEMEEGRISFDMVKEAMITATSAGGRFYGMMDKQSKTVGGRISTLIDKIQLIGISMGEAIMPAIGFLADLAIKVADNIDIVITFTKMIGALSIGVGAYMAVTNAAAIATAIWTKAQAALNFVMALNPIGIVIAAIVALVAAIAIAWEKSETFRGVVFGLWEALKAVGDIIWQYIKPTFESLKTIWDSIFNGGGMAGFIEGLKGLGKQIIRFVIEPFRPLIMMFDKIAGTNINSSISKSVGSSFIEGVQDKLPKAFEKGFKDGVEDFRKDKAGSVVDNGYEKFKQGEFGGLGGPGGGKGGGTDALGKSLKSGLSTIQSSAPKTFNVNIGKLIENLTFESRDNTADTARLKDSVMKILLEAVNDVQLGAV